MARYLTYCGVYRSHILRKGFLFLAERQTTRKDPASLRRHSRPQSLQLPVVNVAYRLRSLGHLGTDRIHFSITSHCVSVVSEWLQTIADYQYIIPVYIHPWPCRITHDCSAVACEARPTIPQVERSWSGWTLAVIAHPGWVILTSWRYRLPKWFQPARNFQCLSLVLVTKN